MNEYINLALENIEKEDIAKTKKKDKDIKTLKLVSIIF